jgi:choline dehydrogenase-like flavoprotein
MADVRDHIVVGAGAAGCALARRLVDAGRGVLLVETGGPDTNPAIHRLDGMWDLVHSEIDHGLRTEPQQAMDGVSMSWPRGRVLGGTTALNGMVHVRGNPAGYDSWPDGWSYAELLPYFRRSEDHESGASEYHGVGGPLPVATNPSPTALAKAWLETCVDNGMIRNDDHNGARHVGAGLAQHTVRDGHRATAWIAYIRPIVDNPLLTVSTENPVRGLLFDGARCVGVRTARGTFRANGDVILSAGTIGSAHILLHSGIGPADELRALGIDVHTDLPEVGENLHDHPAVPLVWEADGPLDAGWGFEAQFFDGQIQGMFTAAPLRVRDRGRPRYGCTVLLGLLTPESRGRLWLRSADPDVPPALDPRYLDAPADLAALAGAVELGRRTRTGFKAFDLREWEPGEPYGYVRRNLVSFHHQVGTCRMGGVVDAQLRVLDVDNLRVVDASVMPMVPAGNTNAATVALAERGADLLLRT